MSMVSIRTLKDMYCSHFQQVDASSLEFFVLDEADKLFEMGFVEQLDQILALIKVCDGYSRQVDGISIAFFLGL